jgi:glycosyltransferase involved in cell wall biosynthesis
VIIPAYNRGANAMRAVRSVLEQTEKSVEVLLIDDGSTDDTPQLFANPPERVRYLRKANGGASSARNAGMRHARGEWIALLDSDDEWTPDKLQRQLEALGTHYVAAACRHVHINVDGSREDKPEVLPGADKHLFRDLYANLSLKTSSLIFKRHLLERVGLFNERFPVSNDWDFFLRVAKAVNNSGFVCLPEPLVIVHRSSDSLSKVGRANALEEALTRIRMVNALLHTDDPGAIARHIERAGRKHLELARAHRKQGDKQQARDHAKEAMRAGLKLAGLWRLIQASIGF